MTVRESFKRLGLRYWMMGVFIVLGWGAIAPSALAESRQLDYTLSSQGSLGYSALVQQAEVIARDLMQQSFTANPDLSEVFIRVMGEHNGSEAPLLYVIVSREAWQTHADIHALTRYFGRSSAVLLGFAPQNTQPIGAIAPAMSVVTAPTDTEPNFYN